MVPLPEDLYGGLAWAPGPELLFAGGFVIEKAEPDGGHLVKLAQPSFSLGQNSDPAWSPDGRKIAFQSFTGGGGHGSALEIMDSDGSNRVVEQYVGPGVTPAWSPDGIEIAESLGNGLGLLSLTSNSVRQLTDGSDGDPAWSPDGSQIAFDRTGAACPGSLLQRSAGIFVVDRLSSAIHKLTSGDDRSPSWSPDGTRLLFTRLVGSSATIWTIQGDGTHPIEVASVQNIAPYERATWSPDGRCIAFIVAVPS